MKTEYPNDHDSLLNYLNVQFPATAGHIPVYNCILGLKSERSELLQKIESGTCSYAGPGRGDCLHFIGYPSTIHKPKEHDGPDDTLNCYGKPNGWCWQCWKSFQIAELEKDKARLDWLAKKYHNIQFPHRDNGNKWRIFAARDGLFEGATLNEALDSAISATTKEKE